MAKPVSGKNVNREIWLTGAVTQTHVYDIHVAYPGAGQLNRHQALSDMHGPSNPTTPPHLDVALTYNELEKSIYVDAKPGVNGNQLAGRMNDSGSAQEIIRDLLDQKRSLIKGPIHTVEIAYQGKRVYLGPLLKS